MMENKDYIDTITKANEQLIDKVKLSPSQIDCWNMRITPYDLFKREKVKWYVKIYRKLFPTRSYINWRVKQYLFRWKHRKFLERVDQFIAWGDDIKR